MLEQKPDRHFASDGTRGDPGPRLPATLPKLQRLAARSPTRGFFADGQTTFRERNVRLMRHGRSPAVWPYRVSQDGTTYPTQRASPGRGFITSKAGTGQLFPETGSLSCETWLFPEPNSR